MQIRIRPAHPDDATVLAAQNRAMAWETEHLKLDPDRVLDGVVAALADSSKGFYTVAEAGDRVIGQLMITFEWSDWRNGVFWWIQSVYVDPEFRGRGIFRSLYEHLAARARTTENVCGIRLYVEKNNATARKVYENLGMRATSYDIYEEDFVLGETRPAI